MEKEKETSICQRQWLLDDVMPLMLQQLQDHLQQCLYILSFQSKADALPLSSAKNETIKGVITLKGLYINSAELQIKSTHNAESIKVSIDSQTPYFLEQTQQGKNYIGLATRHLQTFQGALTKQSALQLLDTISHHVGRARLSLLSSATTLFPYKVCHSKSFSPPLRQDLVIEFYIQDVCVVCNVYWLDYSTRMNKFSTETPVYVYPFYSVFYLIHLSIHRWMYKSMNLDH
ncbi:Rogdi leucine zipper containing protein-domain-containing protein [Spinellus fusiger]|nr:Rogdi leucine zipper containing protein-domain-containing protein [Spinellus fusiger]